MEMIVVVLLFVLIFLIGFIVEFCCIYFGWNLILSVVFPIIPKISVMQTICLCIILAILDAFLYKKIVRR